MRYIILVAFAVCGGFLIGHQTGKDIARIEVCQLEGGALMIDTNEDALCMKQGLIIWRIK